MENTKTVRVMIAAKPGIMRNSLLSYLRTIANVQIVALADSAEAALRIINEIQPQLVVVDSDLSEERVLSLIQKINDRQPKLKMIVLVDSIRQQERCLKLGVQHVLLKGFLDEQLCSAVLSEI